MPSSRNGQRPSRFPAAIRAHPPARRRFPARRASRGSSLALVALGGMSGARISAALGDRERALRHRGWLSPRHLARR
jgi:hypothetical protein